jgi:hypothetical protein
MPSARSGYVFQVDMLKSSSLPLLKKFLGTDEGLELKVIMNVSALDFSNVATISSLPRENQKVLGAKRCNRCSGELHILLIQFY